MVSYLKGFRHVSMAHFFLSEKTHFCWHETKTHWDLVGKKISHLNTVVCGAWKASLSDDSYLATLSASLTFCYIYEMNFHGLGNGKSSPATDGCVEYVRAFCSTINCSAIRNSRRCELIVVDFSNLFLFRWKRGNDAQIGNKLFG